MDPESVASQVRERSGLDVQAVTLVRAGAEDELAPWVWAAMTEHGHFWAVEDGESLELFRAVARRTLPDDLLACHSAVEAARRFLLLHPRPETRSSMARTASAVAASSARGGRSSPGSQGDGAGPNALAGEACQACGTTFTRRRQTVHSASSRPLCPRCRHAERERLRYQQDPGYRARRLAYSAARYRQSQQAASGE
jgi:hypothetical protein